MRDLYKEVTDQIVTQIKAGVVPWRKPWAGETAAPLSLPSNGVTGKYYQGVNIPMLWASTEKNQFPTHQWATFQQWKEKDRFVRKGEKGTMIIYYDTIEREDDGEIKKIPFIKQSFVFNTAQLQDYAPTVETPVPHPLPERLDGAEQFIKNTGAAITYDGGTRNYYRPATDSIHIVSDDLWTGSPTQTPTEAKYATIFHELGHWSGHSSRLNREMGKRFGDKKYAMEELVAELTAAFTCADLAITDGPRRDHADYLANWLEVMEGDPRAIFTASSEASKAHAYLKHFSTQPA